MVYKVLMYLSRDIYILKSVKLLTQHFLHFFYKYSTLFKLKYLTNGSSDIIE